MRQVNTWVPADLAEALLAIAAAMRTGEWKRNAVTSDAHSTVTSDANTTVTSNGTIAVTSDGKKHTVTSNDHGVTSNNDVIVTSDDLPSDWVIIREQRAKGRTWDEVAETLTEAGIRNSKGNAWRGKTLRKYAIREGIVPSGPTRK